MTNPLGSLRPFHTADDVNTVAGGSARILERPALLVDAGAPPDVLTAAAHSRALRLHDLLRLLAASDSELHYAPSYLASILEPQVAELRMLLDALVAPGDAPAVP
jgi:hypothetical protein